MIHLVMDRVLYQALLDKSFYLIFWARLERESPIFQHVASFLEEERLPVNSL